jgi:hypothetical protein
MHKDEIDALLVDAIRKVYPGQRYMYPKAGDAYSSIQEQIRSLFTIRAAWFGLSVWGLYQQVPAHPDSILTCRKGVRFR